MKDLEKQRLVQEEEPSRGCREFQMEEMGRWREAVATGVVALRELFTLCRSNPTWTVYLT